MLIGWRDWVGLAGGYGSLFTGAWCLAVICCWTDPDGFVFTVGRWFAIVGVPKEWDDGGAVEKVPVLWLACVLLCGVDADWQVATLFSKACRRSEDDTRSALSFATVDDHSYTGYHKRCPFIITLVTAHVPPRRRLPQS